MEGIDRRRSLGRQALLGTVVVLGLVGSFVLGRATGATHSESSSSSNVVGGEERRANPGSRRRPPVAPRLAQTEQTPACGCEPTERRETAASLLETLFRRLPGRRERLADVPETSANAVRSYLQGMTDAVKQTSPAVRAALAEEFNDRLCGGSLRDDELITMAYLGLELPDITAPRGFDCVFTQRGEHEDAVVWYMLDAWRYSGHDKSAAIAQIERSATDPRTRRRFLSREEEVSMRLGGRAPSSK
jgi:hypothetical protein